MRTLMLALVFALSLPFAARADLTPVGQSVVSEPDEQKIMQDLVKKLNQRPWVTKGLGRPVTADDVTLDEKTGFLSSIKSPGKNGSTVGHKKGCVILKTTGPMQQHHVIGPLWVPFQNAQGLPFDMAIGVRQPKGGNPVDARASLIDVRVAKRPVAIQIRR